MKVLHVIPAVAERYGGPSRSTVGLVHALAKQSVEVLLLTTNADGRGELDVAIGVPASLEGVPTMYFPRRLGEAFKYASGLRRWMDYHCREFDIVHVHGVFSYCTISSTAAARKANRRLVVRPLGQLNGPALNEKRLKKMLFLRTIGRDVIPSADVIHCASERERADVLTYCGGANTIVLPNGVEECLFEVPPIGCREVEPRVLYLGRLHPHKRIDLLLEASANVQGRVPTIVLAGSGDERYVSRLLRGAPSRIRDRIEMLGWVPANQRADLIGDCDLVILPSASESFGMAAAEAMAAGRPVAVASGVGVAPDVERCGGGWVFGSGDELTDILDQLGRDPGSLRERGERARRYAAQHFRWSAVATRLKHIYEAA